MKKLFENSRLEDPKYSGFNLSHTRKFSTTVGKLIPVMVEEVLPGDQFSVKTNTFMRVAPMIAPIMHEVDIYIHYFFVPNRITWSGWETFITGGRSGDTVTSLPTVDIVGGPGAKGAIGSLFDFFGGPATDSWNLANTLSVNALDYYAYWQIYNDWYRDPSFEAEIDVTDDTATGYFSPTYRYWPKDYFTSALPWPQRGPTVNVPTDIDYRGDSDVFLLAGGDPTASTNIQTSATSPRVTQVAGQAVRIENINEINIDLRELRRTSALQRFFEIAAIGGSRYIEQVESYFGVKSSDSRFQRAEYLGGGRAAITISEVLNSTGPLKTGDDLAGPVGDMAGHGLAAGQTAGFKKFFEEHGIMMGIMSVVPKATYQNGIPKRMMYDDRFDYAWPTFANIGEQEVQNYELYYDASDAAQPADGTLGYQQRYAHMKYRENTIHGEFRDTLDHWHWGRKLTSTPTLTTSFLKMDNFDDERIFAVQDGSDYLYVNMYHDFKVRRKLPYFADPKLA